MRAILLAFASLAAAGCIGAIDGTAQVRVSTLPPPGEPVVGDAGAEVDAGSQPPPDAGSPPPDAGSPPHDAGTPPPDAGNPVGGCSFPQGVPDGDFIASAASLQDTDPAVDAAVNAAMVKLTGCSAGSACRLDSYAGASTDAKCQSWFRAVTQELRGKGFCAGQHELDSTDEIAVSATGCAGRWYGYHVCNYGGPLIVWNPGARRGWWQIAPSRCPPSQ